LGPDRGFDTSLSVSEKERWKELGNYMNRFVVILLLN